MSNGIDFVIGGKDNAKPAMASVEQSLSRLEVGTNRLQTATQGLMAAMGPLLAVYAAVKTAMAAIGGIEAANTAFDEHAKSVSELEVALKTQGVAVGAEMDRLEKYADTMQRATGENDSAVMAVMKEAAMLGVAADKLDDMTTAAYGLAEATGKDVSSSMTMMRQATEGNFEAFNKAIPQLKHMTTDEEKFAAVLALSARGMEAKATWASQVEQSGARASTAIDKLMESVGAILAPFRVLISTGIETAANALSHLLGPAVEYATALLENMGPMIEWVKDTINTAINAIIGTFTFFEVALTHLGDIWTIVVSSVELYLLQMAGAIEHTLMEVIPGYVMWFGENIINLFKDAFNGVLQVYYNATRMIAEIMVEMWKFVFEDMGAGSGALGDRIGAILASGLTTGFESSLTDLPDIAGRVLSDREKDLAKTIGDIGANLGDEFSRKMKERMVGVGDGLTDEFNKTIDLQVNSIGEDKKAKRKDGTVGASINAMESRLLTRGPTSTYEQRMLDLTARGTEVLKVIGDRMGMSVEELKKFGAKLDDNAILAVPVP